MKSDNVVVTVSLKDAVSAGLKEIRARLQEVQDAASRLNATKSILPQQGGNRESTGLSGSTGSTDSIDSIHSAESGKSGKSNELIHTTEAIQEKNRIDLEELATHGQARTAELQSQADTEVAINQERNDRLTEQDRQQGEDRLEQTRGFAEMMSGALESLHTIGLAQGKVFLRAYQAMSVIQTTIDTYKAAQSAYAQGVGIGGPVLGAVMAGIATAAGMARVASIRAMSVKGYAYGGLIENQVKNQGFITGSDRGERADNVLIRATPGEYMFDRPTVRHYGIPVLEALRQRRIPREVLMSLAPAISFGGAGDGFGGLGRFGGLSGSMRTAYALGGEISSASLPAESLPSSRSPQSTQDPLTVINVMDVQREMDRALSSVRGRRLLLNILGEEGVVRK